MDGRLPAEGVGLMAMYVLGRKLSPVEMSVLDTNRAVLEKRRIVLNRTVVCNFLLCLTIVVGIHTNNDILLVVAASLSWVLAILLVFVMILAPVIYTLCLSSSAVRAVALKDDPRILNVYSFVYGFPFHNGEVWTRVFEVIICFAQVYYTSMLSETLAAVLLFGHVMKIPAYSLYAAAALKLIEDRTKRIAFMPDDRL